MRVIPSFAALRSVQRKIALIAGCGVAVFVLLLVTLSAILTTENQRVTGSDVDAIVADQARETLRHRASAEASAVRAQLDGAFDAARTMAQSFSALNTTIPSGQRRGAVTAILRRVLEQNPDLSGTYSVWEPKAIEGIGGLPGWTRAPDGSVAVGPLNDPNGTERMRGNWYRGGRESVLGPVSGVVQGRSATVAKLSVPIVIDGQSVGVAGTTLDLDAVQRAVTRANTALYEGKGAVLVVSDTGLIVANSADPGSIGKPAANERVVDDTPATIRVIAPVRLGRSGTQWSVVLTVPRSVVLAPAVMVRKAMASRATSDMVWLVLVGIGGVIAMIVVLSRAAAAIARPIRDCAAFAEELAGGNLDRTLAIEQADEVGTLAEALRTMQTGLRADIAERAGERARADGVVQTVATHLEGVSQGDLTVAIAADFPPQYQQLKAHFNTALASLRDVIGAVGASTAAIRTGSTEIAQASEDLAHRTESNAASLEETSAALIQIDDRLKSTVRAAIENVQRADQAIATVDGGRATAVEAVQAMGRVSSSAEGIDGVIEGLDKIAFQTRVLAMNAAIEAGRAGDAGRGFAVVADLVSALAMRAEEEAKRARNQLTLTQTDIVAAVQAVEKVDKALFAISSDVEVVHKLLAVIASDSQAQSVSIAEITATIGTMDRSTQQNAAMVEETSAAARNLAEEVKALDEQTSRFNVGADATVPAARPRTSTPAQISLPRNGHAPTSIRAPALAPPALRLAPPASVYRSPVAALGRTTVDEHDDWNAF